MDADIVELGPMGVERRDEDGWKTLSSLCSDEGNRLLTDTRISLMFCKDYLHSPGTAKADPVCKAVPRKRISPWHLAFCSWEQFWAQDPGLGG